MGSLDNLTNEELARLHPDMELCAACDGHRPAARAFIRWHRDTDRDPQALPQLFEDWETETMHAHGWARAQPPEAPLSPPAPTGADRPHTTRTRLITTPWRPSSPVPPRRPALSFRGATP
ncbi:DUF6300 family protein [Streptomyces sp. NPDC005492]|uniref:DUF6300 family protein n=1 Tax=Streptomyces sp. NPDC005492 TaxID=3156883 RepID=UPI0033AB50FC